jgi:hypothetical protein
VLQIPVPSGKTVTAKFYRNIVLRKLMTMYQIRRPKAGLKHLLHDHAPAHKTRIVTEVLESSFTPVIPKTLRCKIISCFQN